MSEVQPRNALNLWKNAAVALALEGTDGQARMLGENNPLPVSFAPGATSDPDAAREVTLQQVRDGITALAALLGSTDGLETLLSTQATYLDQVESLLSTLGGHTDGLEGLLSALGVKDDATLAKLEEIRVLTAALTRRTDTQPVSAAALPLPTGAATSALQTAGNTSLVSLLTAVGLLGTEATQVAIRNALTGTLLIRSNPDVPGTVTLNFAAGASVSSDTTINTQAVALIEIGAAWTAADITIERSTDGGATWNPLYDGFGNALQYRVAASRPVVIPLTDLFRRGRIRVRSGVPGAPVAQAAATTATLTLVTV